MRTLALLALVLGLCLPGEAADTVNWPQFRGAASDGLGAGATLPDDWDTDKNVVWQTDIPGWGWSSPVVWGDQVFVTSAVTEKKLDRPVIGGYPGGWLKPTDEQRFMLYCLDARSGKKLWEQEAFKGPAPEKRHPRNSYASETPVTDGEHVFAWFGNVGLYAYDMKGKKIWEQRLPAYPIRGGWGTGTSPVLYQDRLFIQNDNEKESYLAALDKRTGKEIWRVAREERSNWSTPYIWENDKRTELVTIGTAKIRSYDLDGKLLWELKGTSGLVSLMPVAKHGLLYVGAGYHIGPIYAIKPGATGDITLKGGETSNEFIAWSHLKGSGIHPSYLIVGGRLYVVFDAGFVTCYNAKTGEILYNRQRLETGGGRFYASPWSYHGKVFLLNEDGATYVLEDGPTFKQVGKNVLEDNAWATPAIAQGALFVRTYSKLYRLEQPKK
ncbi:MAG: PQQ-binding-like beta-propeller repeat protein [Gemmataceae bacterium]